MDYGKVLKRAWETVCRYRALWVFGIIIALTTASGGGGGGGIEPPSRDDSTRASTGIVLCLVLVPSAPKDRILGDQPPLFSVSHPETWIKT